MLNFKELWPIQAMAASMLIRHKRLMLALPRQEGGKTELGVRISHDITRRPDTTSCLTLAKDYPSLVKMTREKFMRIFDPEVFAVNSKMVYLKANPTSVIYMGSVDKDPDRQRGGTHNFIHWAEVAFSKFPGSETIADVWGKVIKPTTDKRGGVALLESTNNGKNGWYDLWNSAADLKFKTLKVGLDDMVYLGLVSPDKYATLEAETHPDIFRQEYLCEWVTFQGRAYQEFHSERHVKDIAGPESWQTVVAAIDWGYHPSATCVLFGYVKDDVLHVFDELYAHHEMPKITADNIDLKRQQWNIKNLVLVADHDPARVEELRQRFGPVGIPVNLANKVNVMGARMQIKEALYFDEIAFHPRCKMLRRDIEAAVWHPKNEGELDDSACSWGHWDGESALRYLTRELSKAEAEKPQDNPHMDGSSARAYDLNKTMIEDSMENN